MNPGGDWNPRREVDPRNSTQPKFNNVFTPENEGLEDFFPFGKVTFQGLC